MTRLLDWTARGLAFVLLAILALLSVRGIIDPAGGAASFGLAITDPASGFYHAVYRDRNLVLAVIGFAFLFSGMWRALAILATVSISLPVYDIVALQIAQIPVKAVHPTTAIALVLLSAVLWLKVARER